MLNGLVGQLAGHSLAAAASETGRQTAPASSNASCVHEAATQISRRVSGVSWGLVAPPKGIESHRAIAGAGNVIADNCGTGGCMIERTYAKILAEKRREFIELGVCWSDQKNTLRFSPRSISPLH
jgi:hypothetical protein